MFGLYRDMEYEIHIERSRGVVSHSKEGNFGSYHQNVTHALQKRKTKDEIICLT